MRVAGRSNVRAPADLGALHAELAHLYGQLDATRRELAEQQQLTTQLRNVIALGPYASGHLPPRTVVVVRKVER